MLFLVFSQVIDNMNVANYSGVFFLDGEVILSQTDQLRITFSSDESDNYIGFLASFQAGKFVYSNID